MSETWQLQEVKNKSSEVVNRALVGGLQHVTRRGVEVVVIFSTVEYRRFQKSKPSLVEFFRDSPLVGVEMDLARDQTYPRDEDL